MIDSSYAVKVKKFKNGALQNSEKENQATGKVLSFAKLTNLSEEDTLRLWAEHFVDTAKDPTGTTHQNIREFMKNGWKGVEFEQGLCLEVK